MIIQPSFPELSASKPAPQGFLYRPDFISLDEEQALLDSLARIELEETVIEDNPSRRRSASFQFEEKERPMPPGFDPRPFFLLRERIAEFIARPAGDFQQVAILEYPRGASLGWHRDHPIYGIIVGVSLLGACRFRLRQFRLRHERKIFSQIVEPRSLYVMSGHARSLWQHSVPSVEHLRYSLTFRTLIGDAKTRSMLGEIRVDRRKGEGTVSID